MGTAVLLLGAEGLAAEQLVRAARQLGVRLHLATTRELYERCRDRLRKQLTGVVFTDFRIPESAVDHLAAYCLREGIGAVAVSRDSLSPTAAALSARLGLPGHDPARATAACNRWHMAQAFRENGVPSPFTLVAGSPETAGEQVRATELDWPLVVRSANGPDAAGMSVVASLDGLPGAVRRALMSARETGYDGPCHPVALIQEYLEGPEYTVVTVLHGGRHEHVAVIRRFTTGGSVRVETGQTVPAGVEACTEATILAAVSLGLEVLGLREGIAHTGLALTPDGPKLIQAGAGPPDGATMEMIEHATGVNVARTYLQAALGQPPDTRPERSEAAAVRFISTVRHGVFHELTGLTVSPHVIAVRSYAEPGELVGDTHATHTRLGHLIVVAATPPQADAYADSTVVGISSRVKA